MERAISAINVPERIVTRPWIGRRLIDLVMILILIAGLGKSADISQFASDLRTWTLVPPRVLPTLALIAPLVEIVLTTSWLLRLSTKRAPILAVGVLVVFTTAYLLQIAFGERPTWGCAGVVLQWELLRESATYVLVRNAALTSLLLLGIFFTRYVPNGRRQP